ncbi:hypothetical protein FGRMN_285, partial [Fusarium graminum]
MKAILTTSYKPDMLLPFQLGVRSPGGVEPAIFLLQEAISGPNQANYKELASIDLENAFNSVDRASIAAAIATYAPTFYKAATWAYNSPSILAIEEGSFLASSKGAQGTLEVAREVLDQSPFQINLSKSQEKPLQDLRQQGLKALGTYIGPISQRRAFLQGKLETLQKALEALRDLPKQHSLLLLRGSIQLLLRHLQRQLDPIGLDDLWQEADTLIQEAIKALIARRPSEVPKEPNPDLIAIPAREGGLGIPLYRDLAKGLFQAAKEDSDFVIKAIKRASKVAEAFTRDPSPEIGKSPQEVLQAANKARLACLLETCPSSYKQARLENASYLG